MLRGLTESKQFGVGHFAETGAEFFHVERFCYADAGVHDFLGTRILLVKGRDSLFEVLSFRQRPRYKVIQTPNVSVIVGLDSLGLQPSSVDA
jgi:hypothetical protein